MSGEFILYDSKLSGNGWKVRLLLTQLQYPFRRVTFNLAEGKTRTPEFIAKNPISKVPVLETSDGKSLFESNAILVWLARGTVFLPDDADEQSQVLQWMFFEQAEVLRNLAGPRFAISIARKIEGREAEIAAWQAAGNRVLGIINAHLASRTFFVADRYTIADIAHYPYISMADQGGYDMTRYPHIAAWTERVRQQPRYVPLVEN
jgi:glutathione S-transferase